jgi:hypothetical protein
MCALHGVTVLWATLIYVFCAILHMLEVKETLPRNIAAAVESLWKPQSFCTCKHANGLPPIELSYKLRLTSAWSNLVPQQPS